EFGGVPDTVIPQGAKAESVTGIQFETTGTLIIGKNGKTTGDMRAVQSGAMECKAGHLERVASSVLGWETVSNPTHAVVGREAESDISARRRRKQTLAKNTVSVGEAITSSLYELEGVNSLSFRENYGPQIIIVDGIKLLPHSVYVCVEGGDREAIARALLRTKTIGAAYNGQEMVNVTERVSGQEYEIRFDRPSEQVIFCRVTVKKSPIDAQRLIPAAVEQWVRGDIDGDNGLVVGREVSPFEIAAAINAIEPRLFITNVELSQNGKTWQAGIIPIKLNEIARLHRSSVQVVIT
ncbi:baseplate J/gp47 family protein, partial [Xenorhabdus innexi]